MNIKLIDRLWLRTKLVGKCWILSGTKKKRGHIVINIDSRKYIGSRLSLCIYLGINYNDDWTANHTSECKDNACWNPLHLYQGDAASNSLDSVNEGTHFEANRTHCDNGHLLAGSNLKLYNRTKWIGKKVYKSTVRICRACAAERTRKYRLNHSG